MDSDYLIVTQTFHICQCFYINFITANEGGLLILKRLAFFVFCICSLFLLFQFLFKSNPYTKVFHITEEPATIVRGTNGFTLTLNISFGDEEVSDWIETLDAPYPLLFLDLDWAERFPETIQLIQKKKIPTGLLGAKDEAYIKNEQLLSKQIKQYLEIFNEKPLWFRTQDERFSPTLHTSLWKEEINPLGASSTWEGKSEPILEEGEIISVPYHKENRIDFPKLDKLMRDKKFTTIDEVLFGSTDKIKKIPGDK